MFLGHLCMNKRNFLRKGASLVGSGALLGSAFMLGSSVGAANYKEMCQSMLNESWKYFFARMLAAIWLPSWKAQLEKETFNSVLQKFRENVESLIDENFESDEIIFSGTDLEIGSDVRCYSCRFLNNNKRGENLCIEKSNVVGNVVGKYTVYCYDVDSNGYKKIRKKLCEFDFSEENSLDKANDFFETLDYYVTRAKMKKFCSENRGLFKTDKFEDAVAFEPKKEFYIEEKKVFYLFFPEDFPDQQVITLENVELLCNKPDVKEKNYRYRTRAQMTQYMKEILKQAEKTRGVKVLGTENKKLVEVDRGNAGGKTGYDANGIIKEN